MNVNAMNARTTTHSRNPRAELRALMRRDLLLPTAVGYQVGISADALCEWLKGERKSAQFVALIVEFIDAYNFSWNALTVADNADRAQAGLHFLGNVGVLLNEMENASGARRGELRDALVAEIVAARRVIEMMGAEGAQSPERVAETIRSALKPGDTMLIRRGKERGIRTD
jgi:hypothetical protein